MVVYAPAQIISAPAQLITAPTQPPATGAVVYSVYGFVCSQIERKKVYSYQSPLAVTSKLMVFATAAPMTQKILKRQ